MKSAFHNTTTVTSWTLATMTTGVPLDRRPDVLDSSTKFNVAFAAESHA